MAVKIRLKRLGKIRAPYYRIVVADSRTKRDGRVIEEIGKYHPTEEPSIIEIKSERALYWLGVGAQPTEQVMALLKLTGDWGTFKGEKGATSTVRTAEAKAGFQADEKKKPVLRPKTDKVDDTAAAEKAVKADKADKADKAADAAPADEAAPAGETLTAETAEADTPAAEEPAAAEPAAEAETPAEDAAPAAEEAAEDAPAEDAPAEAAADDADKA